MADEFFCQACIAASEPSPPLTLIKHQWGGDALIGSASRCSTCGSTVETLWFVFFVMPMTPADSYRVIRPKGTVGFYARLVPLAVSQVIKTWLVAYALCLGGLGTWAAIDFEKFTEAAPAMVGGGYILFHSMNLAAWLISRINRLFIKEEVSAWRLLLSMLGTGILGVGLFTATIYCGWLLDFQQWPEAVRLPIPFLVPLLVIIPGVREVLRR